MADTDLAPQVISNQPIPILDTTVDDQNETAVTTNMPQAVSADAVQPATITDTAIATPPVASDVVGTSLDTQQRLILGEYSFGNVGAMQVGTFEQGVSGYVRLSPTGILAVDDENNTTFSVDATTGQAYFSGGVQIGGVTGAGYLKIYDSLDNLIVQGDQSGLNLFSQATLKFSPDGSDPLATLGINPNTGNLELDKYPAASCAFYIDMDVTFGGAVSLSGSINTSGDIQGHNVYATDQLSCVTLFINGVQKTAIVNTTRGYKEMYCVEGAEVWFMDFCAATRKKWWKFWKKALTIDPDPLFLETIERISYIMPTEDPNIVQIWGIRKGFNGFRMRRKTYDEFEANNKFWSQPFVARQ